MRNKIMIFVIALCIASFVGGIFVQKGFGATETKIDLWGCKVQLAGASDKGTHWEVKVSVTNGNGVTYNKVRAELTRYENNTEKLLEKADDFTENFKHNDTVTFTFKMKEWSEDINEGSLGWHPHFKLFDVTD